MLRIIIAIIVAVLFLWIFALSFKFIIGLVVGTLFGAWVTYGLCSEPAEGSSLDRPQIVSPK